jgi:hypothetical protein
MNIFTIRGNAGIIEARLSASILLDTTIFVFADGTSPGRMKTPALGKITLAQKPSAPARSLKRRWA